MPDSKDRYTILYSDTADPSWYPPPDTIFSGPRHRRGGVCVLDAVQGGVSSASGAAFRSNNSTAARRGARTGATCRFQTRLADRAPPPPNHTYPKHLLRNSGQPFPKERNESKQCAVRWRCGGGVASGSREPVRARRGAAGREGRWDQAGQQRTDAGLHKPAGNTALGEAGAQVKFGLNETRENKRRRHGTDAAPQQTAHRSASLL